MTQVKVFEKATELKTFLKANSGDLGLVPTMGALHEGHIKLVAESLKCNKVTVVSIFVNPTQFNEQSDLQNYPKTLEKDLALLDDLQSQHESKTLVVFHPTPKEIYPYDNAISLVEHDESLRLEGKSRPGHFNGMLTVVLKLFLIAQPSRAYFGMKDFQQFLLVKKLIESFHLDIELLGLETVREDSGLPLSSRNQRLSIERLRDAAKVSDALIEGLNKKDLRRICEQHRIELLYDEEYMSHRHIAFSVDNVRLIDHVQI
jgi:pantoate--beta-alanine ligase